MAILSLDPTLTAAVVASCTVYLVLYRLQTLKLHPNEPPIVPSRLPYVGHLLGMVLEGGRYVKSIGYTTRRAKLLRHRQPIFTLPVPGSRIYVVTDPALAVAVQRASKTLSFTPLVPDLTKRVIGLDAHTVALLRENIDPEPGEPHGFLADMHNMVYEYLGPGEQLNALSVGAANELGRQVAAYAAQLQQQPTTVDLLAWVQHFVTLATAQFLYGTENPLARYPELEQAFWDFDHGLGRLLIGVVPYIIARAPYRGREALVGAFKEYLSAGQHETVGAAPIVQRRVEIARQHGFTLEATARSELSFLFAGIVNTATTTFWTVLQIFARPELLATVRAEVKAAVVVETDSVRRLNMELLKNGCPVLHAVFRECLRMGSDNYSTRLVKTDTVLAGQWHLKAGSVVQIAGGVIHSDENIWGANTDVFDPARFQRLGEEAKVHPAAFRAFGGGKTLCPGRHFATSEILFFTALIVLTFDLKGIVVPVKEDRVLPVHVLEPRSRVSARVQVKDARPIQATM
ncbi:cytochrome P450 [Roridomyces roridus]|uniref:Cytochrome P450 n=1 Tax=Roridomyces roridus TaxID=1738132 RepID=A0AAD7CCZ4_9AGAR|nr:cytochrome P450 [Roridomyces roridus]